MTDVPDPTTADHEFLLGAVAAAAEDYGNGNAEGSTVQRVSLRTTHPNLYKAITTFALISIGLGANFFLITPAFNQYGLSKIAAVVFTAVGVAELAFLNVTLSLRWLRVAMACGVSSFFFYGGALTTYYFQTHATSLQLPITYLGLSVLLFALLIEPPNNPVTNKRNGGNGGPAS